MKTLTIGYLQLILIGVLFTLASCSPKSKDSMEVAEDKSDKKFDNDKIDKDIEFAISAADGSMLEIELGKLAQANGLSEKVIMFGEMMTTDQSKVNEELKTLASQKNIMLPTLLSDKSRMKYNNLAGIVGKDFDDAFTDLMVKDYKESINEFRKEADKGNDTQLKSWAAGKVLMLEHHLERAKQGEELANILNH